MATLSALPTALDRTCERADCGAGPFDDLRELAAHRANHRRGRPRHARATRPGPREVRRGLAGMVPVGVDVDVIARLAAFVVEAPNPAGVILVGVTYGPQVVARRYVGDVVEQAGEPLLVVTPAQVAALLSPGT